MNMFLSTFMVVSTVLGIFWPVWKIKGLGPRWLRYWCNTFMIVAIPLLAFGLYSYITNGPAPVSVGPTIVEPYAFFPRAPFPLGMP